MKFLKYYYLYFLLLIIFGFSILTILFYMTPLPKEVANKYVYHFSFKVFLTQKGRDKFQDYYSKNFFINNYLKNLYGLINVHVLHVASRYYFIRGKENNILLIYEWSKQCKGNSTCLRDKPYENYFFTPINKKLLITELNTFSCKQQFMSKIGMDYILLLIPDKSLIEKGKYPFIYSWLAKKVNKRKKPYNEFKVLEYFLTKYSNVHVVNITDNLLQAQNKYAKEGLSLYYTYDFHWNMLGAYIGYEALMKDLQKYKNGKYYRLHYSHIMNITMYLGTPEVSVTYNQFYPNNLLKEKNIIINDIVIPQLYIYNGKDYEFKNKNKSYKFYVERDSFFFNIIWLMQHDLNNLKVLHRTHIKKNNAIKHYNELRKQGYSLFIDEYVTAGNLFNQNICAWLKETPNVDYNKIITKDNMGNNLEFIK